MVDVFYNDGDWIVSLVQHWHWRKTAAIQAAMTQTASVMSHTDNPNEKSRLRSCQEVCK